MLGLLAYNYQRFGSPFEFGQKLALSGAEETKVTHFSLSYVAFNFRAYVLAPAQLSTYFPFVRAGDAAAFPARPLRWIEDPYGILPNMPFVLFALVAPLACVGRRALGYFAAAAAFASFAVAAVIFMFQFATNRYMVDFLPGLVIVSVVGFFGLRQRLSGTRGHLVGLAGWVFVSWSVLFNLFAAFGHNELLRLNNPDVFARMEHAFGWPRHLYDEVTGRRYGPLELILTFPTGRDGKVEPLVVSGTSFISDYLYVTYVGKDKLVLGFEHAGYGGPVTPPIPVDFTKTHRLTVDMPSLYPPRHDPYFDGIPAAAADALSRRLKIWLDGDLLIDTPQQFHPAFGRMPGIGSGNSGQHALGAAFTGTIVQERTLNPDWRAMVKAIQSGPLLISLAFPANKVGIHEPVVTTGSTGRGDVLVVNYVGCGPR